MVKILFPFFVLFCQYALAQKDVIHNHEHAEKSYEPLKNQPYVDPKAHLLEPLKLPQYQYTPQAIKGVKKWMDHLTKQRQIKFDSLALLALHSKSGHLLKCETCQGSGNRACKSCQQLGIINCGICDGKGDRNCLNCRGSGVIRDVVVCPTCDGRGRSTCISCQGAGKKICSNCKGLGIVNCNNCQGAGVEIFVEADSVKN